MNETELLDKTDVTLNSFPDLDGHAKFSPILLRAPLASHEGYYRPTTFVVENGINPLTAAASALMAINTRLKQCDHYNDIHLLYQQLVHEIKAFESQAQNLRYRTETILVARYVLCATLDETIMNTVWGKTLWQHQLLNTFQREDNVAERFFLILDRISEDASHHVDLLELIYLCLSSGFEGKFRILHNGKLKLDAVIDSLFRRICKQRMELKTYLQTKITPKVKIKTNKKSQIKTLLITTTSTLLFSLAVFYSALSILNQSIDHTNIEMKQLLTHLSGTE